MNHFRLDFEQQGKRAKDLLKAARAGDGQAIARFSRQHVGKADTLLKLADAQRVVARELRFDDWAAMKRHIAVMDRERERLESGTPEPLDADLSTLHVRCGSDLRQSLKDAGFVGEFVEHSFPYLIEHVHEGIGIREPELLAAARFERVVVWSEGDVYDQLVLVRVLAHLAAQAGPARVELIDRADFPGGTRFIGLGQLPPEALRLLWTTRRPAGEAQRELGVAAWHALADPDPRALAGLARTGTPALPLLAPALRRHLAELPAPRTGLSLTERMALEVLAEGPLSLQQLFARVQYERDPLPGQGDRQVRDRVLGMEIDAARVFERTPGRDPHGQVRPPWTDVLSLTDLGRQVLRGELDFRSLAPPPRWVGGVPIAAGAPDWRWDDMRAEAICRTAFKPAGSRDPS